KNLQQLQILNCNNNQIQALDPLKNLQQLQKLDCYNNQIHDLSSIWRLLEGELLDLRIDAEKMQVPPPAVAAEGRAAIVAYFRDRGKMAFRPLYEAKVLVVGEGRTGKTSLIRRLNQEELPEEEDSTRGIEVRRQTFSAPEDGQEVVLNLWDFGGQDIYYSIHQLFLTQRSLYILLDSTRTSGHGLSDPTFRYWLEVMELLGGQSPVLIFLNEFVDRPKGLALHDIQSEFPQVKAGFQGNLGRRPTCVEAIWQRMQAEVLALPQFSETYPPYLLRVRERLEALRTTRAIIRWKEFYAIFAEEAEKDGAEVSPERARILSGVLHNLGVILHFHDERPRLHAEGRDMDQILGRMVILRNEWATDAIYRLLDDPAVNQQNGRFTYAEGQRVWDDATYGAHVPELLGLMQRFELCYKLYDAGEDMWLLPGRLPEDRPSSMQNWGAATGGEKWLELYFRYEFLPRGMVNRLMVRNHRWVPRAEHAWKHGCLFEFPEGDAREGQLLVHVRAGHNLRFRARGRDASTLIENLALSLESIHDRIPKLKTRVRREVPCNCPHCSAQTEDRNRTFFDYEELVVRKRSGDPTMQVVHCFKQRPPQKIAVLDLLEGIKVQDPNERWREEMRDRVDGLHHKQDQGITLLQGIESELPNLKGLLGITQLRLDQLGLGQREILKMEALVRDLHTERLSAEEVTELVRAFDERLRDLPAEVQAQITAAQSNGKRIDGPLKLRLSLPLLVGSLSKEYDLGKFEQWLEEVLYRKLPEATEKVRKWLPR
ncbi:MAG: COR domain-containing protein, partial [Bacteroidota bacterium]